MKVLHVINSLKKGGAEGNLYRLCKFQKLKYRDKIDITIITLINNGYYEKKLRKKGIKILSLCLKKKYQLFEIIKKIIKLRHILNSKNPDVVQTWMYHSNFISLFFQKKFYQKIFWNIRHSQLSFKISKKKTILLSLVCGFFSRIIPKKIIYCSEKSIKFHVNNHFYCKKKTVLIYNGYSEKDFYPSKKLRLNFRKKHKIKNRSIVLGYAGRYAKQKNIGSLLDAFSKIKENKNNTYVYMAGQGINSKNRELVKLVSKYDSKDKVFLLDEQKSLLEFYNGIDLLVLTSHSESFPNVIAEAMLCSTPVLASNAGCSKKIIDKYGFVLNKNDYLSITKGLKRSINILENKKGNWKSLKKNVRSQIKNKFSIEKMAHNYSENWIS